MLPSVSAGSAALMKYAQAIATAAPETTPGNDDGAARAEQEAARHKADNTPTVNPAQEKLAQSARETVTALLDLLRARVATALIELGVPETQALKAADSAAAQLATTIAGDTRHAAEIVHALLDRLQAGTPDTANALLNIVARGITVVIDHQTGDIRITPPRIDLTPVTSATSAAVPTQHLLDVTDYSAEKATPVLQALNAVQSTASAYAQDVRAGVAPATVAGPSPAALLVAPTAFVDALTAPITAALQAAVLQTGGTPQLTVTDTAKNISTALSHAVATTINTTFAAGNGIPVADVMTAVSQLKPVAGQISGTSDTGNGRIVLAAGNFAVAVDTTNSAITVQVGNRITTYAVGSAASPIAAIAPLPQIEAASLPVLDIPAGLPVGKVLDLPIGTPFIPPEISDMPATGTSPLPGQKKPTQTPIQTAGSVALALEENLQHLDPSVLRNATIIRGMEAPSGHDLPGLTRIALDLSAEIGPGVHGAVVPPPVGKLGLPQAAPQQTAAGPVMKNGYADAAANLVPVLPPTYRRGDLVLKSKKKSDKKKQQLQSGQYQNVLIEDAMTRDMPAGHQGLVFSSVVFSV
ncbi:MAG: hypothetical protein ACI9JL_001036 [Paracoccaceae bacterium]|jgi:hypothetical protein